MNRSYSKIRHIQESNLRLEKRFLNEENDPLPKTSAGIMALQQAILNYEMLPTKYGGLNVAGFINDSNCDGRVDRVSSQGRNDLCKITGTTLCSGPCTSLKAVDGIYGANTKKAYDKYKSDETFKTFITKEGSDKIDDSDETKKKYSSSVNNWQIPATEDTIKAFQYFVWRVMEKDLTPTNPDDCKNVDTCLYPSILCGGNACLRSKGVDGRWGSNTKTAWNKYKAKYLKVGWDVGDDYNKVNNYYNTDNSDNYIKQDYNT